MGAEIKPPIPTEIQRLLSEIPEDPLGQYYERLKGISRSLGVVGYRDNDRSTFLLVHPIIKAVNADKQTVEQVCELRRSIIHAAREELAGGLASQPRATMLRDLIVQHTELLQKESGWLKRLSDQAREKTNSVKAGLERGTQFLKKKYWPHDYAVQDRRVKVEPESQVVEFPGRGEAVKSFDYNVTRGIAAVAESHYLRVYSLLPKKIVSELPFENELGIRQIRILGYDRILLNVRDGLSYIYDFKKNQLSELGSDYDLQMHLFKIGSNNLDLILTSITKTGAVQTVYGKDVKSGDQWRTDYLNYREGAFSVSPNRSYLAAAGRFLSVYIWHIKTDGSRHEPTYELYIGNQAAPYYSDNNRANVISGVGVDDSGRHLAIALEVSYAKPNDQPNDHEMSVYDVANQNKIISQWKLRGDLRAVAFVPRSDLLLVLSGDASHRYAVLYNWKTGTSERTFIDDKFGRSVVRQMQLSPDGETVAFVNDRGDLRIEPIRTIKSE